MSEPVRLIKKYPNRRLYDTKTSAYITLGDVKDLVLKFEVFKVLDATIGVRVSEQAEVTGLDLAEHSETAYHGGTQTMERM